MISLQDAERICFKIIFQQILSLWPELGSLSLIFVPYYLKYLSESHDLMLLKIRSVQLTGSVDKDVAMAGDLRSVSTSHSRRGDLNFYKLFSVVHTHTVQLYMHT